MVRSAWVSICAALLSLTLVACGGTADIGTGSAPVTPGGTTLTCPAGQVPNAAGTACVASTGGGVSGTGVPQTLQISSAQPSIIADGTSAAVLTATLLDTAGQPISGKALAFTTNAGSFSTASANTGSTGSATTSLISTTTAGRATIVVREATSGLSASTTVSFTAGPATNLAIAAAPSTVAPAAQSTIGVTVTDANGNRVAGESVTLNITTNASGGVLSSFSLTTDANGQANSTYTSGSGTGTDTVQGKLASGTAQTTSLTVTAVVRPANGVAIALGNSTPTVNSTSSVTATVVDSSNNPLQNVTVSFQATSGSIPASAQTDAQGRATVNFTAPATTGSVTITASSAGIFARASSTVMPGQASSLIVSLAPAKVAPGRTTSVTARLTDGTNAIQGRSVQFTAPGGSGSFSSSTAVTDASGVATVSFTAANSASTTVSSVTISAAVNPEGVTGSQSLTVDPSAVSLQDITLTALSPSAPADGVSTVTVRAKATGSDGQPLSGVGISFSSSLGLPASGTQNTDASGNADFVITAPSKAGSATVKAASGGVVRQIVVNFTAGPASIISLTLTPNSIGSASLASATALVTDANNNPVEGETVQFSVPTNSSGGAYTSGTALQTAADGTVTATYRTGSASATTSNDVLQVTLSSNSSKTAAQNLTILSSVGALTLTAGQATLVANGTDSTTLTARVTDSNGNPLKNASVQFRTSKGTLSPSTAVTTDSGGVATVQIKSDLLAGNAAVSAVLSGSGGSLLTASTGLQFVADVPAAVSATASPASVAPGAAATVVIVVTDANNNRTPNQNLKLTQTANISGGTPSQFSLVTDANGRASLTYTMGATAGTDTLLFATDNNKSASVSITASASNAVVGNVSLNLGATSVQADSAASTIAVRATVTASGSGAPVAGASVNFTSSGGTLASASGVTDANGIATVQLTAPTKASTVTLRASVSGFIAQQSLTVTPGPAAAVQSSITVNPSTILADGNSTATITVVLNDQFSNPLPDGTAVTVNTTAGSFVGSNSGVLTNGQATFTLKSSTTPNASVVIAVPGIVGLQSNTVNFAASTTGDPASLRLSAASTGIFVAGVGQNDSTAITVNVLDSSGAAISEAGYPAGTNNLRVSFLARPNGGEVLFGRNAANAVISSSTDPAAANYQSIDVATSNGIAVLNLQSGTISGIVELKFAVLTYAGTDFNTPSNVAASSSLPQVSIASGPAASIVFTQPITNAITNLGGGNYRLTGSIDVRDQYGNNVPDGTVLNLAAIDSVVVHDNTGATTAGVGTLTRSGNSLETVRCNEPGNGREATSCNAASASSFSTTITRNGTSRGAQVNDTLVLRNAVSRDKKRTVKTVDSATQVTAQSTFTAALTATTTTNPNNGEFWLGTQASGVNISGVQTSGGFTTGKATTTNGIAPIVVDYPANSNSILLGCYGYPGSDGSYSQVDRRDSVPQSRQVILAATAGNNVTGINAGDFCFKAIAGVKVTPSVSSVSLSPASPGGPYKGNYSNATSYALKDVVTSPTNGAFYINILAYTSPTTGGDPGAGAGDTAHWNAFTGSSLSVSLSAVDGGDQIPLPFLPISCTVSYVRGTTPGLAVVATISKNLAQQQATGFDASTGGPGVGSVTVTRTDATTNTDDVATVNCNIADGVGSFMVSN